MRTIVLVRHAESTWVQTFKGVQQGMLRSDRMSPLLQIRGFQEMSWGKWEKQPRNIADQPSWADQRRTKGFDFYPPGGESYAIVRARA